MIGGPAQFVITFMLSGNHSKVQEGMTMTMEEDREKLKHLIGHWVEHNRSHEASYSEWAMKAREMGDVPSAELIDEAVALMKDADEFLLKALAEMK